VSKNDIMSGKSRRIFNGRKQGKCIVSRTSKTKGINGKVFTRARNVGSKRKRRRNSQDRLEGGLDIHQETDSSHSNRTIIANVNLKKFIDVERGRECSSNSDL
jgi:hypothetical protein